MKFLAVLQLIFVALKLTKVIAWSWWLVLLPAILPCVIVGILIIIYTILISIEYFLK